MLKKFFVGLVVSQLFSGLNNALINGAQAGETSDSDNIRQLRSIALQSCASGDLDAGLNSFDGAIRLAQRVYGPDSKSVAEICFEAGMSALKADRYQKAEECLTQAVKINPNAVESRLKLAEYYKVRGRLIEAKQHLHRVLAKHPECAEARSLLTLTYQQEGNSARATDEAYRLHELVRGRVPKAEVLALAPHPPLPLTMPVAPLIAKPDLPAKAVVSPAAKNSAVLPKAAPGSTPVAAKKSKADIKKEQQKLLEQLRKAEAKSRHEAQLKRDAKLKRETKAKRKQNKSQPPAAAVATGELESSWGVPARLHSKAVLLTPVGKKAGKTVESAEMVKATKVEKQVAPDDTRSPEAGVPDASSDVAPAPKSKAPVAKAAKAVPVQKIRAGLVPPPPPVVPVFPSMPMMSPPPQPRPKPPEKVKPVVVPEDKHSSDDKHGSEDDSDFLLDWAGKNKKKGK